MSLDKETMPPRERRVPMDNGVTSRAGLHTLVVDTSCEVSAHCCFQCHSWGMGLQIIDQLLKDEEASVGSNASEDEGFLMRYSESEDADKHLLVDWKGNGGKVTLVQQSLPFKQVKRRDAGLKATSALKELHLPTIDVAIPENTPVAAKLVVAIPENVATPVAAAKPVFAKPRPTVVVSLSDSDVSGPPRRINNNPHHLYPPGTSNVVCLDSDTDSERSFQRCRVAPCSASRQKVVTPLEKVVDLDDEGDECGPHWSPPRVSSGDHGCTLDPFGSGRSGSPIREGSSSKRPASPIREGLSSKRPASSLFNVDSGKALDFQEDEDDLAFPSATTHTQLPIAEEAGTRKKRKTTRGAPMTEEEKALERKELLRAKEAERLRKAEEKAELKRQKDEEKKKTQEENRRKREEEKLRKEVAREEAKERRRLEHEKKRWENGKFALQNTRALIDTKVIENGVIGGHLLNKLADKQLQYQLVSNPCPRSIIWRMKRPSEDSSGEAATRFWDAEFADSQTEGPSLKLVLEEVDVPYVLYVMEAEEFANVVGENTLHALITSTQARYPAFTICFLINKLKWYLNKKEQTHYKSGDTAWKRPPCEQVLLVRQSHGFIIIRTLNTLKALARLVTHYNGVHSRLCLDEAEVAEHVTGLMRSLADCPFKARSTSLSVSKNGEHVTSSDTFREEIKKSLWLKALVALPRTPGAVALAVAKKYGNMRALLKAYLDPTMTVHQKELLLQDLIREGVFGPEQRRRVGPTCSRRIYRIFMAQNGNLKTDDVEEGADHFDDSDE